MLTWIRTLAASAIFVIGLQGAGAYQAEAQDVPQTPRASASDMELTYPDTRRSDQVDDYHGEKVADPYRWLEDPDSPETKAWIAAQNELTSSYLARIPGRERIKNRLTELWNYEKFGVPFKYGDHYFYLRNDGLQNQSVLYVTTSLDAEPRVLLDPNTLLEDGTAALTGLIPSEDGKLLAYGVAKAGSDWEQWSVRDVETGRDLPNAVDWVKFTTPAWAKDGSGFYYSRFDEPAADDSLEEVNQSNRLYFHKIGEPQSSDRLVYERPDQKKWIFDPTVTDDGRYLIVFIWKGSGGTNQFFYQDLQQPDAQMVELISGFDAAYTPVGSEGERFWIQTDANAPFGKLVEVDLNNPERSNWKTIIPETGDTLRQVSLVGDRFFAEYLKDAASEVKIYGLDGQNMGEVDAPALSTLFGFTGSRGDTETFYGVTNFSMPGAIYRYDLQTNTSTLFAEPDLKFDPADFETKQAFATSKDGTRVPMFITHRRGLELDGNNPLFLYGYGGFNLSMTPSFLPEMVAFMEKGGVFVRPTLRGGGEYGTAWHEAGMFENKQNVFDDFIASAEWLIDNKYTRPEKLAIYGGSNGGLLVGAVMTQRPELFGAVMPVVGVLDMLRFQKFTIGWAWADEYGSSDNPEQFPYLRAYSPVHNVEPGTKYPPTLVMTGDHDDRVPPMHSYKFIASLQHAQAGDAPVLIRVDTRTGHGQGKPTDKQIAVKADLLAFMEETLNMTE